VDFGCGSGSLLDSLLDYPTSLERIVGVDISTKAFTRATKTLHTKLSNNATVLVQSSHLKSALLLDGARSDTAIGATTEHKKFLPEYVYDHGEDATSQSRKANLDER
ncbi:small RNA 2'-O-methyltransferase, partial [Tanacetum coccineum]